MVGEFADDGVGDGGDVGSGHGGFDNVQRMANARYEHFGQVAVVVINRDDLLDQLHTVGADVVEAPDERADEVCSGFGGEQRLRWRKDQRGVGLDAVRRKVLDRLEAFDRKRALDDHILVDGRKLLALSDHLLCFERGNLGADRAIDDFADFLDVRLEVGVGEVGRVFDDFSDQRRVGRDAVEHTEFIGGLDFVETGGVDKEFHKTSSGVDRFCVEHGVEVALRAALPVAFVIGVSGDERHGNGGFSEDHLLVDGIDLAPRAGLLERRAGERAVTFVGHGDLHGVGVHRNIFVAKYLSRNNDVLRKVLRHAAADHEDAGLVVLDLDFGQLAEVLDRVDGDVIVGVMPLVVHQAETGGAVRESRAEDRHAFLVGFVNDGVLVEPLLLDVLAHLDDELARRVRAGRHRVGDDRHGVVADAKLVLVDVGVVDAVDGQFAKLRVVGELRAFPVLEAKRLEEVLIDDVRAGRDDGVNHVVFEHVDDDLLQPGADKRTGEGEDYGALLVFLHQIDDGGRASQVTRLERHVGHLLDHRHDVVFGDADVLDRLFQVYGFVR